MIGALKRRLFGSSSKNAAKSRLHFVLVQDRTGLTAEDMAQFKEELVTVIGKYFVIDKNAFDVTYERDSDSTTLLINSPVEVKHALGKSKINKKIEVVKTESENSVATEKKSSDKKAKSANS